MMTEKKPKGLIHLRATKLHPEELLCAAEWLKIYARNHRRRTHVWMISKLGIPRVRFYRVLAIGKWSKKVKQQVKDSKRCLSQTSLFRLADRTHRNARALHQRILKLVAYLKHRKRKRINALLKQAKEFVQRIQKPLPQNKLWKIIYREFGKIHTITVPDGQKDQLKDTLDKRVTTTVMACYVPVSS